MNERLLVLAIAGAVGALLFLFYNWYRQSPGPRLERLDVRDLGLELMTGCCAFVVFTSPSCTPCRAVLRIVGGAARKSAGTDVTTVDVTERPDVATRYGVRSLPTTFLITASGHIVRRWTRVPGAADVELALHEIGRAPDTSSFATRSPRHKIQSHPRRPE